MIFNATFTLLAFVLSSISYASGITYAIHSLSGEAVVTIKNPEPLSGEELHKSVRSMKHELCARSFKLLHGETLIPETSELIAPDSNHMTISLVAIPTPTILEPTEDVIRSLVNNGFWGAVALAGDAEMKLLGFTMINPEHKLKTEVDFGEFFGRLTDKPDFCLNSTLEILYKELEEVIFYKGSNLEVILDHIQRRVNTITPDNVEDIIRLSTNLEDSDSFVQLREFIPVFVLIINARFR